MKRDDDRKKIKIATYFKKIMETIGLDLTDDSLSGTPTRLAKMYVDELFSSVKNKELPKISVFDNKFNYDQMLIEKNIDLKSVCEHHFQPIVGYAHIAYIPKDKVVGLSKLNRVVDHFARMPQVQERLTQNIIDCLTEHLQTEDIAVTIDAKHFCVLMRGVLHNDCLTRTTALSGQFKDNQTVREEYLNAIGPVK